MQGDFCVRIDIDNTHHDLLAPHQPGMNTWKQLSLFNVVLAVEILFWKHETLTHANRFYG